MAHAQSDTDEPVLCILNAADVLAMNAEELRTKLQHRSLDCTGLTKPALQAVLLANIGVLLYHRLQPMLILPRQQNRIQKLSLRRI